MARGDTRGSREFYTGKELEADTFGEFKTTPAGVEAFKAAIAQYADVATKDGWIPRDVAMELIRKYTEDDPTNPPKEFASELRTAVAEKLGILPTDAEMETMDEDELDRRMKDGDRVRFLTAVATPADHFHGIDAWIEVLGEKGGRKVVTLDVTRNTDKIEEGHKAQVIVGEIPAPDDKGFLQAVNRYAAEIVWALKSEGERAAEEKRLENERAANRAKGRRRIVRGRPEDQSAA